MVLPGRTNCLYVDVEQASDQEASCHQGGLFARCPTQVRSKPGFHSAPRKGAFSCQRRSKDVPLLDWALGVGRSDCNDLIGEPGIRWIDAHGKTPHPQHRLQAAGRSGVSRRAESDGDGQGSRFTFTLPAVEDTRDADAAPAGTSTRTPAPAREPDRILVVDDDQPKILLVLAML